ncbi:hypothetical protein PVAG01_04426 [Phlyctema vagabunda]|uniref:Uncharacterized protein n=1 Tax=Phlyctema vagabunda TaxID=108571 RepID=A0ABR4PP94_9HELO
MSADTVQPSPYGPGDRTEVRMRYQRELSEILRGFKHDPRLNGILSMTRDGVLLSLTADRQVVDAVGLKPELVKAMLDRMPYKPENETRFRGADGTKVPREQWFYPDKSDLPPPYEPPPERRQENMTPEMLEQNRKFLAEKSQTVRELHIVSDHDLGLKTKEHDGGKENTT